jgi:hypothetical protein
MLSHGIIQHHEEPSMSESRQQPSSPSESIPREVEGLVEAIKRLPDDSRQAVEPFLIQVVDGNRRRRKILSLVQDALSQLRLDMKYLAFDLEATRRERDDLRRKLEESA